MTAFALFGLPGPGDEVIQLLQEQRLAPRVVVHAEKGDFSRSGLPRLPYHHPDLRAELQKMGVEFMLVAGWEKKFPLALYEWLPRGAWNLHPSLLPAYRGFNPYFWVIANGEAETGVTVHRLTEAIDGGPILLQLRSPLDGSETLATLWHRLGKLAAKAAVEAVPLIMAGAGAVREQPIGDFPVAPRLVAAHLQLAPEKSKTENERLVRAANPYYGATIAINGMMVKVFETSREGPGPEIACRDGVLYATVVQAEGEGLSSGRSHAAGRKQRF